MKNSDGLDLHQLRAEAWRNIEPLYLARLAKLVENYQIARSRQLGPDDLAQVVQAVTAGRVGTLLVEDDRQIAGKIERTTGRIQSGELSDPEVDDVLDDLADLVLRIRGDVVIVLAQRMPSDTGAAAIYRF